MSRRTGEYRICEAEGCNKQFYVTKSRAVRGTNARFCSVKCFVPYQSTLRMGREHPSTFASSASPSVQDVAWAAGIFEGEGHCRTGNLTTNVRIGQKDAWLVERLLVLFGGMIHKPREGALSKINGRVYLNEQKYWDLTGPRARGFLMTIYKFLSLRRQAQVKVALGLAA